MDAKILDKLDMMIVLGAKDCGNDDVDMLDNLDTSKVVLDKSFHRKKVRIVEKHKHHSTILALKKGVLCIISVLVLIASLGFTTIMAISPMRKAVFGVVVEWYENYITIRYEQTDNLVTDASTGDTEDTKENPENSSSNNGSVIVPPTVIKEVRKPTLLDENVIEDIVMENKAVVCIDYYKGEELAYTYNQMLLSNRDMYLDNEGAIIETIDINGNAGTVIQHSGFSAISIYWSDGEYIYQVITQTAPLEEVIAVCRSVK